MLSNLNTEIDKLKHLLKECLENNRLNRDDIKVNYFEKSESEIKFNLKKKINKKALEEAVKILDQTKADKDWVRQEFDKVFNLNSLLFFVLVNLN